MSNGTITMSNKKTALVAGGAGVIGRNLVNYLAGQAGWEVIGLSRNKPELGKKVRWSQIDLLDQSEVAAKIGDLSEVSHVFFAAYQPRPTYAEEVKPNLEMLRNLLAPLQPAAHNLERIILNEGVKAYGVHLGPFKTPAKETDPRHLPPNFYYAQEDHLKQEQIGKSWDYTILRPDVVCGFSVGSAMNLPLIIATYAAISRELGVPLRFPGKVGAYQALAQVTDATLHAEASVWAAVTPSAKNEIFNVTNGDFFRWEQLWPKIAEFFDMPMAEPQTISLVNWMADKGPVWDAIVAQHRLQPHKLEELAGWKFGDLVFGSDYDVMSDTTKIRRHGFHRVEASDIMMIRLLKEFREAAVIP
jgi:nucleoside-diphosphate-sugar epimerase